MTRKPPTQTTLDAAGWLVRLRAEDVTAAEIEAFADWLRAAPANVQKYLKALALWDQLGAVDPASEIDLDAILAASNIVPLAGQQPGGVENPAKPRGRRRRWLGSVAASIVAVLIAGTAWWLTLSMDGGPAIVSTALGEQRSVALDDGSVIQLNTQSTVRVALDTGQRRAELIAGEALFDIARDPDRPFIVVVDGTLIRVVGTRFNVRRGEQTTTVTVLEGEVTVSQSTTGPGANDPAAGGGASLPVEAMTLQPGMQATVGKTVARATPESVNAEKTVAWTDRRLIFEGATLDHIVAEFNRYNLQRLVLTDASLGSRRLTGTFDANDTESFLLFLQQSQSIVAVQRPDGHRELVADAPQQ